MAGSGQYHENIFSGNQAASGGAYHTIRLGIIIIHELLCGEFSFDGDVVF